MSALGIAVVVVIAVIVAEHFFPGPRVRGTTSNHRAAASSVTELMPTTAESLSGFALFMSRCKRTPDCPYYALSVKDKTLKYVGVRNVARQGTVQQPLTSQRKRQFLKLVQKARFFALNDSYDLSSPECKARDMDAPTFTIGVTLNGETKVIQVNKACANVPSRLTDLARGIDRVSHSARWTGTTGAEGS
jgi:hypothetical protein